MKLTLPPVAEGEIYGGSIGNLNGDVCHITVVAFNDPASHSDQLAWAKSIGCDLPSKLEAAALFAHIKDKFEPDAYWTNETFIDTDDPEGTAWAWHQDFYYGYQTNGTKNVSLRAVAVRRLPI